MVPPGPAWETADFRGTSCLINSSHKSKRVPRADWYTPPFASLASSAVPPPLPCTIHSHWDSHTKCSNSGLGLWSSSEDSLSFSCDGTLIPPPGLEFRAAQTSPMEMASNDIKAEPEENAGDERRPLRKQNRARKCLRGASEFHSEVKELLVSVVTGSSEGFFRWWRASAVWACKHHFVCTRRANQKSRFLIFFFSMHPLQNNIPLLLLRGNESCCAIADINRPRFYFTLINMQID